MGLSGQCKLLFVGNDASYFISHRLPVAIAARNAGFDVHIAAPQDHYMEAIVNAGCTFHSITLKRRGYKPWQEFNSFLSLVRLYKRLQPDIVHHVTIKPVLYGGTAARLAGVPAVVNAVTGLGYIFIARGFKAALLRSAVKLGYRAAFSHRNLRAVFQNPDDIATFLDAGIVARGNIVLIKGSGADMTLFSPFPEVEGTALVVLASRMLWDKGVREFVEASRILRCSGINARFVLVGDPDPGNPASVPKARLEMWRNSSVIEWWGRRNDIPSVFANAHVVCLPSYREGLPKVLIEAAACGRPIVTTDTPGCREIVRHGENGLLVPVRDSRALANALRILIENPQLRVKMGARGRQIAVEEFSIERVVKETLSVYRELLQDKFPG